MKFKSKINVRSMGTNNVTDKTPVWDVERTSTGHRAEKPVVAGAEEEEEEYHSHQTLRRDQRTHCSWSVPV